MSAAIFPGVSGARTRPLTERGRAAAVGGAAVSVAGGVAYSPAHRWHKHGLDI